MSGWPEGVPLPPPPQKPEGINDWEWYIYLNSDMRQMHEGLREKVEAALGWKEADVAEAQEIADTVLKAVEKIDREPYDEGPEDVPPTPTEQLIMAKKQNLQPAAGKGHVPEADLHRYRRRAELAHLLSRMGNMLSGMGEYADANQLWDLGGKYKRLANDLRADLPAEQREEEE